MFGRPTKKVCMSYVKLFWEEKKKRKIRKNRKGPLSAGQLYRFKNRRVKDHKLIMSLDRKRTLGAMLRWTSNITKCVGYEFDKGMSAVSNISLGWA